MQYVDSQRGAFQELKELLRQLAKRFLPEEVLWQIRRLWMWHQLKARSRSDCRRYLAHSGTVSPYGCKQSYQALLTKHYHVLEKALSFQSPRPGFAADVALQLARDVERYLREFGPDDLARTVLDVLSAYCDFNLNQGIDNRELNSQLAALKRNAKNQSPVASSGGAQWVIGADIRRAGRAPFDEFVHSRHSIRHFTGRPIPVEIVQKAIQISLKSPSACNRQPWKVHLYEGRTVCGGILRHQSGNRGFGEKVNCLLIVTCDLRAFFGVVELNAAFVDGGMFGMSLLYAVHSLGLGACCLNLSLSPEGERSLRLASGVPDNEVLIMMIAVGELPERFMVAKSCRKPVSEILMTHPSDQTPGEWAR